MANNDYTMLRITGAYIKQNTETSRWRNFSGAPTRFNVKGGDDNREFTVDLYRSERIELGNDAIGWQQVTVDDLIADGWKVKIYDPRDQYPDASPMANLRIKLGYHDNDADSWKDPVIYQYMGGDRIRLDKDMVGYLDDAWIDYLIADDGRRIPQAKIKCGRSAGMVAYLNELHVHIRANTRNYDEWD